MSSNPPQDDRGPLSEPEVDAALSSSTRNILTTLPEVREASLQVAKSAQRLLSIFTQDLEPEVYGEDPFLEAIKRLVLARSYAKVRVLLADPEDLGDTIDLGAFAAAVAKGDAAAIKSQLQAVGLANATAVGSVVSGRLPIAALKTLAANPNVQTVRPAFAFTHAGIVTSQGDRAHHVRFGFGAGVDRRLHAPFEARFGFPLIEAWAMTETGGGVVIAAAHEPRHVGTNCFGKPGPESQVRVVDDEGRDVAPGENGELLVRRAGADPRHGFAREYLKDPAATAEAWAGDWFHTGDVVRRDAEGYLCFVDRKKNVIRRSGENISAAEVEAVLRGNPEIVEAAVIPVPDTLRGEEVKAYVQLKPGVTMTPEQIVDYCKSKLAPFKVPRYIEFHPEDFERTPSMRVQKQPLRARPDQTKGAWDRESGTWR